MQHHKNCSISGPPQQIHPQRPTTLSLQRQRVATITRWSPAWITTSLTSRGFFCASIIGTFRTYPSILLERACAQIVVPRTITPTPLLPVTPTALPPRQCLDSTPAFHASLITAAPIIPVLI